MLKQRIKKLEEKLKSDLSQNKKLRIWTVTIDETAPEMKSKDTDTETQRLIDEIKAGKVTNKDGALYSEEDEHLFIIRIITNDKNELMRAYPAH